MAELETQVALATPPTAPDTSSSPQPTNTVVAATPTGKRMVKKIIRKKRRPARVQLDPSLITSEPPPQTGTIFNIWYNKWSGGDHDGEAQTKAKGRCIVATDAGYTKADGIAGSFFCLSFARGVCAKGADCEYLHRLPGLYDIFGPNIDCFGREKFSDYRDDMGGVGSFMRVNRTVYIGRIHVTDDIEEIVARHFAEWGQVERIRVLNQRGVGFVTYSNEANAQFAKEAMAHQSLDHDEILNVRWATADPNPMAQAREERRIEEQAAEAVRRALSSEFVAEIEGKDFEARKRRRIERSYGLEGYEAPDDVHFARGAHAVNPLGRRGFESQLEEEDRQRRLLSNGEQSYGDGAAEEKERRGGETGGGEEGGVGIFSESTLAALGRARISVPSKPNVAAPAGPLVSYGSDSDDDE